MLFPIEALELAVKFARELRFYGEHTDACSRNSSCRCGFRDAFETAGAFLADWGDVEVDIAVTLRNDGGELQRRQDGSLP